MYHFHEETLSLGTLLDSWATSDKNIDQDYLLRILWKDFWSGRLPLYENDSDGEPIGFRRVVEMISDNPAAGPIDGIVDNFRRSDFDPEPMKRNEFRMRLNGLSDVIAAPDQDDDASWERAIEAISSASMFLLDDLEEWVWRWPFFVRLYVRRKDCREWCIAYKWPLPDTWFLPDERERARKARDPLEPRLREFLVIRSKMAHPVPTKKEVLAEARQALDQHIPGTMFDRVWTSTVPPAWTGPGRRPKGRVPDPINGPRSSNNARKNRADKL